MQNDFLRVRRIAPQKPLGCDLRFLNTAAIHQPKRALHDENPADSDRHREHDRAAIHPAPSLELGIFKQDQEAHRRAD
jgi:hypothetical protein